MKWDKLAKELLLGRSQCDSCVFSGHTKWNELRCYNDSVSGSNRHNYVKEDYCGCDHYYPEDMRNVKNLEDEE